jgi:hypothetical protein
MLNLQYKANQTQHKYCNYFTKVFKKYPDINKKGTYDPKKDETRDDRNSLAGKGKLLTTLV